MQDQNGGNDVEEQDPNQGPTLPSSDEFKQLVERANCGDVAALDQLRGLLDANPEVWQRVGDIAAHAELLLIGVIAGEDQLMAESLKRKLEDLKTQLGTAESSPLECMAIQRLTACWLQLQHVDVLVSKAVAGSKPAKYLLQRQAQADRSYNAALKALTTIRQLLPTGAMSSSSEALPPGHTADGSLDRPATLPMHDGAVRRHA